MRRSPFFLATGIVGDPHADPFFTLLLEAFDSPDADEKHFHQYHQYHQKVDRSMILGFLLAHTPWISSSMRRC